MLIELILNLGALIGISLFTRSILSSAASKRSQVTLAIFLLVFGFHLLAKELAWMWPHHYYLQVPTFALASLLPLTMALHFESLLRRHLSRGFKIYLIWGTLTALVSSVAFAADHVNRPFEALFALFVCGFAGMLSWTLFTRKESDLTPGENSVLNATTIGFLVLFCFMVYELPVFQHVRGVRAGSLGGLVFLYICIRIYGVNESKRKIFFKLVAIFLACAAFATVSCLGLYEDLPYESFMRLWCLSLMGFLGYLIFEHLQRNNLSRNEDLFLTWLAQTNPTDLTDFLESLKSLKSDSEVIVIGESWMKELRHATLLELFRSQPFLSKRDLRQLPPGEGVDQAAHLMDGVGVNAMILVREQPLTFVGMNVAQGGTPRARHELSVIRKICRMLEDQGHVESARA